MPDLALLTDGLRAEREQGITIDVAYRYFATPRRKFILADTPGHVQYTRNMVTGASTADLAIVLVDARHGVVEQTRRHAFLASLLGIRHLVLAVNKMDLVGWDAATFAAITADFAALNDRLGVPDVVAIPMSALLGDNIVDRSARLPWYDGPALLEHLEGVEVAQDAALDGARFPVQYVIRDQATDYRGYAGQVAGGVLRVGDEVTVLPGGRVTTVAGIDVFGGGVLAAPAGQSVTVRLADDVDVARGDLLVAGSADALPTASRELEAAVCWMAEAPLRAGGRYALKHTTSTVRAIVDAVSDRLDVATLEAVPGPAELALNDIGRVRLRVSRELAADPYAVNRATGAFILVDEATNETVAAGMVGPAPRALTASARSPCA